MLAKSNDTILEVSWKAIVHNLNYFKSTLKENTKIMLMVKASAYGYGAIPIAKKIDQLKLANYLGVATIDEGIELRNAGIELPIMVQNPSFSNWKMLVEHCLEPIIHNVDGFESFNHYLNQNNIEYPIHIKVNTGMNRLGFNISELDELLKLLKASNYCKASSILTHLSSSGNYDEQEFTLNQLNSFEDFIKQIKGHFQNHVITHSLNTDGINTYTQFQQEMVRIGIGLFGASENQLLKQKLIPAAIFKSKVVSTRRVKKGETVSYNRSGKVFKDTNIAVLSLGYADGFPRKLGNGKWEVEINGKLFPTIGAICMDLCMLNIGDEMVNIGDDAIIFGKSKSIFDYADALETITYEAVTFIGKRVKRVLV